MELTLSDRPIEGPHPRLFFQRVPEGETVKNRLRLDVRVAPGLEGGERMNALATEANRPEALGAGIGLRNSN